jgi:phosphoglycolate phosphatase-like HAD superfamily hydrolase
VGERSGSACAIEAALADVVVDPPAIAEQKEMTMLSTDLNEPNRRRFLGALAALSVLPAVLGDSAARAQTAPLASWNDGPAKQSILDFVRVTTDPASKRFVSVKDRIATFDQDGTLWVEQPVYAQAMFALDRIRAMAPDHPEWRTIAPFDAILSGNMEALGKFAEKDWLEIVAVTHAGMSNESFLELVANWIETARDQRFKRLRTELVYQPMLEVMQYLRANGYKTYIVTGGGQEFVRAYSERVYGIPPEQVVGSSIVTKYEMKGNKPELMRLPKVFFIDDGDGKAVGINMFIGKRPYAAFGNSDGDREMLEWTGAGDGARLKMLVHHDDPVREYGYGPAGGLPDSKVGTFSDALLTEANSLGWTVVSMRNDWKRVFPFDP